MPALHELLVGGALWCPAQAAPGHKAVCKEQPLCDRVLLGPHGDTVPKQDRLPALQRAGAQLWCAVQGLGAQLPCAAPCRDVSQQQHCGETVGIPGSLYSPRIWQQPHCIGDLPALLSSLLWEIPICFSS